MSAASHHLAFDLGASSGRAILGTFDGSRLAMEEVHRFTNGPVRLLGHWHWDVLGLFKSIRSGLAGAAAAGKRIDSIGIDTWGVDFGLLSKGGDLIGQPYHYRDARTKAMMKAAFERVSRDHIYSRTGIQFMQLNTIYQLLAVTRQHPDLLEAADRLLFMPDLLHYWLTGEKVSEYTIASTSQLLGSDGVWASEIMEKLGLPSRIMPPIVKPGTVLGPLLSELKEEFGLVDALVVAPGCHDTASAVAAVPARGENWAYISSGTWSLVGVELTEPLCNADALAANFTNEGGVADTIRFLKNVAGLWLVQECQRTWAADGEDLPFDELAAMAASSKPRSCFVDPDLALFGDPGDMPARIQRECSRTGQCVPQSKGEIVRCALESLALKYRMNLETVCQLTGRRIDVIHIVGGGVNNELLCQLTADVTGKPVIAGPAEATAAGNLMVQALACGRLSSLAEVREIIANSSDLREYEPVGSSEWEDVYQTFRQVFRMSPI